MSQENKQNLTITVGGTDIKGQPANADFTSDAVVGIINAPWSFVMNFNGLAITPGLFRPRAFIEVSNDPLQMQWRTLREFDPARPVEKGDFKYLYWRLRYEARGANAGSIEAYLTQIVEI